MATESKITLFKQKVEEINSLDKRGLYRENLGEHSLVGEFKENLENNISFLKENIEFAVEVSDKSLKQIIYAIQHIIAEVDRMKSVSDADYITSKQNIINAIVNQNEAILDRKFSFISAKIESFGLLSEAGLSKKLKNIETTFDSQIEQLESKMEEVGRREDEVRRTAAGISVKEAQKQFKEAATENLKKVKLWAKISGGFILLFIGFAAVLWFFKPQSESLYDAIYHTTIRITILITIGAAATFGLRILRAHMHLEEKNRHRERLANSLAAFVEAVSQNQRDIIITNLVESISSFGKSGLLQKDDDSISLPKIVIDAVSKNIPSGT